MKYDAQQMEEQAVLATAAKMCAAARTAPKAKGLDHIETLVLTGADKDALADKMHEVAAREFGDAPSTFHRDAENLRAAAAVVLIGIHPARRGLAYCSLCGFESCAACSEAKGRCCFDGIDLGIALGSAAAAAADERVDSRIMYTVGKAAEEMGYVEGPVIWHGIPLSVTGKSIFFDRKA